MPSTAYFRLTQMRSRGCLPSQASKRMSVASATYAFWMSRVANANDGVSHSTMATVVGSSPA
ncbi:hypothetical protein D3C87_1973170 [compost metagenome]